jgi:hypothetical protein
MLVVTVVVYVAVNVTRAPKWGRFGPERVNEPGN